MMDEARKKRIVIVISLIILAVIVGIAVYLNSDNKAEPSSQTTDTVLMVSPVAFDYNKETAVNNAFQEEGNESNTAQQAKKESDAYIKMLKDNGINVITVKDTKKPHTPDSVFPNNWFSTHEDGTLVLYPMFAENRRIMSKAAYESLSKKQIAFLESKMKLITPDLECIETNGGGSARCMIAEIFSPKK